MKKKIKTQIRQTNIQNLNELSEEQKFEFQKALEKELETKNEEIQILIRILIVVSSFYFITYNALQLNAV